jgi:hypothetical protein
MEVGPGKVGSLFRRECSMTAKGQTQPSRAYPTDPSGTTVDTQIPVPFPTRFQEGSDAVARGVSVAKRRVPPGDGPNGAIIQDRADSPGATI